MFVEAVLDGTFTGKKLRREISELSDRVKKCDITVALSDYFDLCVLIKNLETALSLSERPLEQFLSPDIKKGLGSLKSKQEKLYSEIADAIMFGHDTYPKLFEALQKQAVCDEEREPLNTIKEQFTNIWGVIQVCMEELRTKTRVNVLESIQITGEKFVEVFDIDVLRRKKDATADVVSEEF